MPMLSIIPARAIADDRLQAADLRTLLAIGTHTDRYGAGVWASASTLSTEARVSRSQFFASASKLEDLGYITRTARYGVGGAQLTTMVRVLLDGEGPVQVDGGSPDVLDGESPVATGPKRPQLQRPQQQPSTAPKISAEDQAIAKRLYSAYPERDGDNSYIGAQNAVVAQLQKGVTEHEMQTAIAGYTQYLRRTQRLKSQYVKTMARFFGETDDWRSYHVVRVEGQTRLEWARSGKDCTEFDLRAGHGPHHGGVLDTSVGAMVHPEGDHLDNIRRDTDLDLLETGTPL